MILHGLLIHKPVFSTASLYNKLFQCRSSIIYLNTLCFFYTPIARKCRRAVDEKQEINLLWPYRPPPCTFGFVLCIAWDRFWGVHTAGSGAAYIYVCIVLDMSVLETVLIFILSISSLMWHCSVISGLTIYNYIANFRSSTFRVLWCSASILLFPTVAHVLQCQAYGSHIILILQWLGQSSRGHLHTVIRCVWGEVRLIYIENCVQSATGTNDTYLWNSYGCTGVIGNHCFILIYCQVYWSVLSKNA